MLIESVKDTHEGGRLSAGTVRWEDVEKFQDRPVAYVAMGSHGVWPEPGDHIYADVSPFNFPARIHTKYKLAPFSWGISSRSSIRPTTKVPFGIVWETSSPYAIGLMLMTGRG